jgi:hypothetical protein
MLELEPASPGCRSVPPWVVPAFLWLLAAPGIGDTGLHAQVKPSERATVSQTVDGTRIELDYARPRARGRSELFGGVVHLGKAWTPGANDATVLEINRDIEIEGNAVPAGRWSVWMVVREEGPWEMVLDPRDDLWHTAHPEETDDQIRFPVATEPAEHAEALLWYFPEVWRAGVILALEWGEVRVPLEIEVEPTYGYTVTEEEAAPFLGAWEMEGTRGRSEGQTRALEIIHHEDGSLRAVGEGDSDLEWVLQPKAEGIFALGYTRDGELWAGSDTLLEVTYRDGEPTGFAIRDSQDRITWQGRRIR